MKIGIAVMMVAALSLPSLSMASGAPKKKPHGVAQKSTTKTQEWNAESLSRCASVFLATAELYGMQSGASEDVVNNLFGSAILFSYEAKNIAGYEAVKSYINDDRSKIQSKITDLLQSDMNARVAISLQQYFEGRRSYCQGYFKEIEIKAKESSEYDQKKRTEYSAFFESGEGKAIAEDLKKILSDGMVMKSLMNVLM